MVDTAFWVAPEKLPRFAANYGKGEDGRATLLDDPASSIFTRKRAIASGGGRLAARPTEYRLPSLRPARTGSAVRLGLGLGAQSLIEQQLRLGIRCAAHDQRPGP